MRKCDGLPRIGTCRATWCQPVRSGKLSPLAGITPVADGLCFNIDPVAYAALNLNDAIIDEMMAQLVETIMEQPPFFTSKKAS